jgi:mycofactocin system glycosyltransferase
VTARPSLQLRLDPGARRRGNTLTGGAPKRVLAITDAGWMAIADLERGVEPTGATVALADRLLDAGIAHPVPGRPGEVTGVTIVVPVHDRPAQLDRCLGGLGRDAAVMVVDDGSRDRDGVAAVARRHGAQLVVRPACHGPAAARNAALSQITTDLIAFLDSDCVPGPDWLHGLVGHFDDPRVAAVAPRVRAGPRSDGGALDRFLAARSPLDMGERESRVEPGGVVSYVPTAALVVRRRALGAGFDERLRYGEDVDLVWRLCAAGWRVRYDPSVVVAHSEPSGLRPALARRFRYGTSAAALAVRHPGRLAPAVLSPWPTLVVALLLAGRPASAAWLAGRQSVVFGRRLRELGLPTRWGVGWFGEATYHSAVSVGRYLAMFALPLVPVYLRRGGSVRALAIVALPALDEWWRRRPALDPVRWSALTLADDAAYGAGVWWGSILTRTASPLVPVVAARARDHRSRPRTHLRRCASSYRTLALKLRDAASPQAEGQEDQEEITGCGRCLTARAGWFSRMAGGRVACILVRVARTHAARSRQDHLA